MFDITIITPTSDRPAGLALAARWIGRQTFKGSIQWLIADGGEEMAPTPSTGRLIVTDHLWRKRLDNEAPGANLSQNLLMALPHIKADFVAIMEDDDWYHWQHIEDMHRRLRMDKVVMAGNGKQRYYNVKHRVWRVFNNVGASLCQTGMNVSALPLLEASIKDNLRKGHYGIDGQMWRAAMAKGLRLDVFDEPKLVVGIKGLPGRVGCGVGHRPDLNLWAFDPDMAQLKAWVGDDWTNYSSFFASV